MEDGSHLTSIILDMQVWYKWVESELQDFRAYTRVNIGCRDVMRSLPILTVLYEVSTISEI